MNRLYVLLLLMLNMHTIVFTAPDFSGKWTYDASASTLPYTGHLVILQNANTFIISTEYNSKTYSLEYIADGIEHTYVLPKNGSLRYVAILDGNTLRISGRADVRASIDHPVEDTYILSNDRKTLTHVTKMIARNGPIVRQQIYRRQ